MAASRYLSPVRRFWLVLPLWLALTMGEHSIVHQCPTHGALPVASENTQPQAHHAGHDAAGAAHDPAPVESEHASHACMCIGACSIGAGAALSSAPEVPVATILHGSATPFIATPVVGRTYAQLRIPYPIGPPRLTAES